MNNKSKQKQNICFCFLNLPNLFYYKNKLNSIIRIIILHCVFKLNKHS